MMNHLSIALRARFAAFLWTVTLCTAAIFAWSSPAIAQDELEAKREKARPIALEGFQLLQDGKYNEAIAKLEEAERIFHAPTHLLYIGRARKELGEQLTAYNTFVDILIEDIPNYAPEAFQKAKADARFEAEALQSQIATLEIAVSGAPLEMVTVKVDGKPVPAKRLAYPVGVTAGQHTVEASAEGAPPDSESVEAVVGQVTPVSLTIESAPEPAPGGGTTTPEAGGGSFPVLATVLLAVGGGALVAGAVTGVMTLSKASDIKDQCDGTVCPVDQEDAADDAKLIGNVSTAMFVVGGVLAATGIILLIVDPFGDSPDTGEEVTASVGVRVGPTGAALVGSF
jgi:hypothetical protein